MIGEVGADAIASLVVRRLRTLSEPVERVARALAVVGDGTNVDELAGVAGFERERTADLVATLVRADLCRPGPALEFTHPLVRDAVYAAMAPSERERAHARVADRLRAADATPERIAVHLLHARAGAVPGAVDVLRAAAQRSVVEGAPTAAVSFLERALREPVDRAERATILRELGTAALQTDARSAVDHLRAAVEHSEGAGRAHASLLLGDALYHVGEAARAIDVLEAALPELPPEPELHDRFEYAIVNALATSVQMPRVVERAERLYETHRTGARQVSPVGLVIIGWLHTTTRLAREEALATGTAALAGDALLRDSTTDAFVTAVMTVLCADGYEIAAPIIDRAHDQAVERGSARAFVWATQLRAILYHWLGRLDDAEAEAAAALAVAEAHALAAPKPWLVSVLADVEMERGRLDETVRLLAAHAAPERSQEQFELLLARTRLALERGRPEEGLPDLEELRRRFEGGSGGENPSGPWRSTGATLLAAVGRREEALELARGELERARKWGAPRPLGRALRIVATLQGGPDELSLLEEAAAVLEGSPAQLERAYVLAALGSAQRRAGRRAAAREALYGALELAERCGARRLTQTARDELIVAGARPRRTALRGIDALTASERRVAQLAASGLTNKEAAQALFVTLKTVETHLASVYRKLGIRSRTQLPAALAGLPTA